MRKIKFRAWDKGEKIMFYNIHELYDGFGNITDRDGKKLDIYKSTGCTVQSFYDYLDEEDFEVMQFTGLLDKNGKEIYEGDIIKPVEGLESEVFWWEDHARFACRNEKNRNFPFYLVKQQEIEIIGNIYEKEKSISKDN